MVHEVAYNSSWRTSTVTTASAQDKEIGIPLLTTGDKPRCITQLAIWSGTNTTGAGFGISVIPSTAPDLPLGYFTMANHNHFFWGQSAITIDIGSKPVPLPFMPFGDRLAQGAHPVLPPNSILVGYALASNLNGTIGVSITSYEV